MATATHSIDDLVEIYSNLLHYVREDAKAHRAIEHDDDDPWCPLNLYRQPRLGHRPTAGLTRGGGHFGGRLPRFFCMRGGDAAARPCAPFTAARRNPAAAHCAPGRLPTVASSVSFHGEPDASQIRPRALGPGEGLAADHGARKPMATMEPAMPLPCPRRLTDHVGAQGRGAGRSRLCHFPANPLPSPA
jgi:hypothetical protein